MQVDDCGHYNTEDGAISGSVIRSILERALLVQFLSPHAVAKFCAAMNIIGLSARVAPPATNDISSYLSVKTVNDHLIIGGISVKRRTPSDIALVPKPVFYENPAQTAFLRDLLIAFRAGTDSASEATGSKPSPILLIGNQGVGKNICFTSSAVSVSMSSCTEILRSRL
jgi:hypothetical protein